jgi:hypothetical protein
VPSFPASRRSVFVNREGTPPSSSSASTTSGYSSEPTLRDQVANALFNKSVTLGALERPEEETAAYDELLARFGDTREPAIGRMVEMARELRTDAGGT